MPLPNLQEFLQQIIEVRISKAYCTKYNKGVQRRNFYGNEIYTSDSDAVCILHHMGIITLQEEEPSEYQAISAFFRVVKGRNNYPSQAKNGLRSRKMA
mmetsp:Transcript_1658/g.1119  ORF Transcript_1658/g.1119 Transcript_1658/m.1119 type:complete len:98 (+) Transcript_1658:292-585(+)|eukprot:CAMPEP_0202969352 /NCGR_PEP_ID=MMETSP1396-20130829/15040_1 /ASSEMBLY_ACC=CAM_ASM_000872 /TAXON_ID= /ORGANISM="Pseudokeronopsis sp., Strain Brazil" /LENGTH=97 /DNA_ID=CAMNT_0049696775 /DNA_START=311 /DNA_END=604 /DNA_ORIENTATION=+